MPTSSKSKKREEFMAMVARTGPLPTSALASGEPLESASDEAPRVAGLLVGGLPGQRSGERVERLRARKKISCV